MPRYNILVQTFRNRIENCEDEVLGVCAGLWNLVLSYCGTTLVWSGLVHRVMAKVLLCSQVVSPDSYPYGERYRPERYG